MLGRLALLVNTVGFVLTGDLSWMAILGLISKLFPPATGLSEHILAGAQVFSAPLVLLIMGVFYLWVHVRRCSEHAPT
jgi:fumarate reductase subunit D